MEGINDFTIQLYFKHDTRVDCKKYENMTSFMGNYLIVLSVSLLNKVMCVVLCSFASIGDLVCSSYSSVFRSFSMSFDQFYYKTHTNVRSFFVFSNAISFIFIQIKCINIIYSTFKLSLTYQRFRKPKLGENSNFLRLDIFSSFG